MTQKTTYSLGVELYGEIGKLRTDMQKAVSVMQDTDRKITRITSNIGSSFSSLSVTGAAIFTGLNQGWELGSKVFDKFQQAIDGIQAGDKMLALEQSFRQLQESAGRDAVAALEELQKATLNTVSDIELMEQANKAAVLGLPIERLGDLAAAATKLGRAVGRDAAESFEDLVTGVGRGSALILDNLGIII